jgi:hypothetical protein
VRRLIIYKPGYPLIPSRWTRMVHPLFLLKYIGRGGPVEQDPYSLRYHACLYSQLPVEVILRRGYTVGNKRKGELSWLAARRKGEGWHPASLTEDPPCETSTPLRGNTLCSLYKGKHKSMQLGPAFLQVASSLFIGSSRSFFEKREYNSKRVCNDMSRLGPNRVSFSKGSDQIGLVRVH